MLLRSEMMPSLVASSIAESGSSSSVRNAQSFHHSFGTTAPIAVRPFRHPEFNISLNGQVRKQGEVLKNVADAAPSNRKIYPSPGIEQHFVTYADAAGVGPYDTGYRLERRRLTLTRCAKQDREPRRDLELYVELESFGVSPSLRLQRTCDWVRIL